MVFVYVRGHGMWMGVGCPYPPVRNDIVTPRHLFSEILRIVVMSPDETPLRALKALVLYLDRVV